MPPAVLLLKQRLFPRSRFAAGSLLQIVLLIAIHVGAVALLVWSEIAPTARLAFVLTWGSLNLFWLALLRRPLASGALSLAMLIVLILLSRFKHETLMMTATFVDVMLVDLSTFSFLLAILPGLAWKVAAASALGVVAFVLLWRIDPFRLSRRTASVGCLTCFAALAALSFGWPVDREDQFHSKEFVSKFARSGAVAAIDLLTRGIIEADATASERLAPAGPCELASKPPHIVLVFDESSFDATMMPATVAPSGYRERFRSSDGHMRSLVVEGAGGPSWFTEYNVLSGLSVRSYGRFAESATRLAIGRVARGLPHVLRGCGYKTFSLYSWFGGFAGARGFHTTTGIEHFLDARQLRTGPADTDSFFYDQAARVIAQERERAPVFVFVYLATNHFPWNYRYRPDLLADWPDRGNPADISEYLRRQEMSANDLAEFKARLAREFPDERFLLVRFGDHQPRFAKDYLEPGLDQAEIAQRILARDPRYFTTYYAIEGVNFEPIASPSARDVLDAPYLPLVVLEAAGVPLDPSFAEQRRILERCRGLFYLCADGAEARRFNRMLMDAGLIRGL
ncbi:MAG: LTA synthase family protein [Hyphomicrobiales bacterium]|nr:LTA synthase family protein [Hyphomicrobiales bacterium]